MLRPGVDATAFREPTLHPTPAGSVRSETGGSRLLAGRLLERNLVRLGRAGTHVDRRVAQRLRRLCSHRLYRRLGYVRLVDYLTERLGMSALRCQAILRLERVVEALPLLGRALQAGDVSLSKIETVSGVATASTEEVWLERARRLSVASLRDLVRSERAGVDEPDKNDSMIEQDEPGRLVSFAAPASALAVWHWTLDLIRRVAGRQEPAWRCAEFLAAEFLSGVPDVATGPAAPEAAPSDAATASVPDSRPFLDRGPANLARLEHECWSAACEAVREALVSSGPAADLDSIESDAGAGEDDELDAWELDAQLRRLVRLRQSLTWRQGRLLAALISMRLYRELGFGSLEGWISERLAMSPRRACYLIALDRRLGGLPLVADAYRQGRVSWCQARLLVRVVVPATQGRWMRYAQRVTVRRLEQVVTDCESESFDPRGIVSPHLPPQDPDGLQTSARSSNASAALPTAAPQVHELSGLQTSAHPDRNACRRISFWAPLEVAALWDSALRACRAANGARLEDWECFLLFVQALRDTWDNPDDPQWKRRYRIFERDGWRCMAPGCSSRSALNEHHIVFRSHQGSDEEANLVTLCIGHHQQGVHAGYLRCLGRAPDHLWWELGIRPGGEPLARYFGDRIVGCRPHVPAAARAVDAGVAG